MKRAKGLLLLGIVLMGCEAGANLAGIALQQTMIDDVIIGGQSGRFWPVLAQIGAAYVLYALLFTFGPYVMHATMARMRAFMGEQLMRRMHTLPIGLLHKERTANYVYHFTQDLDTCAYAAGTDGPRFVQQAVSIFVIVAFVFAASPLLLAGMLLLACVYVALGRMFAPARRAASSDVNKHRSSLLVHLEEGVSSTREVIAFHRQEWEAAEYRRKFGAYFSSIMQEGKLINKQLLASEPLKWGALLLVLAFGGALVMQGQLTIGLFVVVFQFSSRLMEALDGLFQFALDVAGKMAAAERIRGVLGEQAGTSELHSRRGSGGASALSAGEGAERPSSSSAQRRLQPLPAEAAVERIAFDRVGFRYGEQPLVLRELSLEMEAGEKIAFVGESGGGKSTIASLLVRFYEPTSGVIRMNGVALTDMPREEWMNRVTLVFQEPYLFADTIRTNLLLGNDAVSEERIAEVCRAMQIDDFIAALPDGYDTTIGERGVTLSGGQRQRLALARAVLRDTEVLVLDEATSSLDLETERRVQEHLDRLRRGRMTIVIAHRLSTVRNADRIFVMDNGAVAEQGTHDELLSLNGVYRKLVESQQEPCG